MKRIAFITIALSLFAGSALARDPGFHIEAWCKQQNTHATAVKNCIDEEKAVRDDVRAMKIPDIVFTRCLDRAKKDPAQASYYSFQSCVEKAKRK